MKVYIVIDDRTNVIAGVFGNRKKAQKCIDDQKESRWFGLAVYDVE